MLANHARKIAIYGTQRLVEGRWTLDQEGKGLVDLEAMLSPFWGRRVRHAEWSRGFEPDYAVEGQVSTDAGGAEARVAQDPARPRFRVMADQPRREHGAPLHVEVECLDADDPSLLTFVGPFDMFSLETRCRHAQLGHEVLVDYDPRVEAMLGWEARINVVGRRTSSDRGLLRRKATHLELKDSTLAELVADAEARVEDRVSGTIVMSFPHVNGLKAIA